MNGAQLHLALNHFPVILSIAGLMISIWGWFAKSSEIKKVGLTLIVLTAAFAYIALLTGEPAEDVLKKLPDYPKTFVHDHEEAGEAALIVSIVAGLGALASLFLSSRNHKFAKHAFLATLVVSLMSSVAFVRTAHLGGLVRHTEIRDTNSFKS